MPRAEDVKPGKWTNLTVLFDNGEYSIVSGEYEGNSALGERWNGGDGELGFPNQGGNPLWHVVPDFLVVPLLHGLLDELARHQGECVVQQSEVILRALATRAR